MGGGGNGANYNGGGAGYIYSSSVVVKKGTTMTLTVGGPGGPSTVDTIVAGVFSAAAGTSAGAGSSSGGPGQTYGQGGGSGTSGGGGSSGMGTANFTNALTPPLISLFQINRVNNYNVTNEGSRTVAINVTGNQTVQIKGGMGSIKLIGIAWSNERDKGSSSDSGYVHCSQIMGTGLAVGKSVVATGYALDVSGSVAVSGTIKYSNYAFQFTGTANATITIGNPISYTSSNSSLPYTTITSGCFQAPISGIYHFNAGIHSVTNVAASWKAGILQSSSLSVTNIPYANFNTVSFIATCLQETSTTNSILFSANMSAVTYCNAGDYIRVFAIPSAGTGQTNYSWGSYNNILSGYLISQ